MRKEVTILLVGVGGFGASYVKALFDGARGAASRPYRVVGAVEVDPAACESVRTYNVPVYSSVERFYASHKADLAVLSTPIYLHYEQTKICVENGSDVLCEKPLCTSVAEAFAMKRLSESSGRVISLGYQMSFSRVTRALKADIAAGLFGAPVLFKTFVFYPRTEAYYARNRWAGMKFAPDGRLVLDSPLHNAVAHHLNNMLFLLGKAPSAAAMPKTVQAELYRGYPNITNYDTVAFRAETEGGVPVLF
ncbi:MAG: Gfo/Idh/MocA family oxidoreductase, partial [Clostridiales bacterium]|nr:Gfo/Idh/MocA family oxidoreductase [Clostridiales bacterium]